MWAVIEHWTYGTEQRFYMLKKADKKDAVTLAITMKRENPARTVWVAELVSEAVQTIDMFPPTK